MTFIVTITIIYDNDRRHFMAVSVIVICMKSYKHMKMTIVDIPDKWVIANHVLAVMLVVLTLSVSVPLTISIYQRGGGPWGFGVIGLHVLLPLSAYILFSIAAFIGDPRAGRSMFIVAHIITLCVGLTGFYLFPLLPKTMLLAPLALAVAGIVSRKRFQTLLFIMLLLGIIANIVLLKWEFEFGRTFPIIEIFQSSPAVDV